MDDGGVVEVGVVDPITYLRKVIINNQTIIIIYISKSDNPYVPLDHSS